MSLLKDIVTQVKGFAHDTVENNADVGRTARQLTRDMGEEIQAAENALVDAQAQFNSIKVKVDQAQADVDKYQHYAEDAVKKGNDALAREALADKNKAALTLKSYQDQLNKFEPTLNALKNRVKELHDQRDNMEQRTDLIEARQAVAKAEDHVATVLGGLGNNTSMASFDQLEKRVERTEALAQAKTQIAAENSGAHHDDKYASLTAPTSTVDDDLAALKAKMGQA